MSDPAMRLSGVRRSSPDTSTRIRLRSQPSTTLARSPGAQVSPFRTSTPRPSIHGRSSPRAPAVPSASPSSTEMWTAPARWASTSSRRWHTLTATAPSGPTAVRARAMARSTRVSSPTGHSTLGRRRVRGRSRAPSPAASTTAQTSVGYDPGTWGIIAGMTTIVQGIDGLRGLVGQHLGYSVYVEVTQEQVNLFADATGDHQWIHVDVERAKQESPFGGPIAHGYLTLSMGPRLVPQVVAVSGISMAVNYGCNKVRFPSPVPVGSKLRVGVELADVTDIEGGAQVVMRFTFECEGAPKPACVAENVFRYYA